MAKERNFRHFDKSLQEKKKDLVHKKQFKKIPLMFPGKTLPVAWKNVARRFEKLWAMQKFFMGKVLLFYGQCFLRLRATEFGIATEGFLG